VRRTLSPEWAMRTKGVLWRLFRMGSNTSQV
jgi:hypothetical protein